MIRDAFRGGPEGASDAAALAELHSTTVAVAYAHIFPSDSLAPSPQDLLPDYERLLSDPTSDVLVCDDEANERLVIGSIALVVDDKVPAGRRIERFNIRTQDQGAGIGATLYAAALARARDHHATELNLWVLKDNERARAIYEHWGWTRVPGFELPNEPPEVVDVLYRLDL